MMRVTALIVLLSLPAGALAQSSSTSSGGYEFRYHSYRESTSVLEALAQRYPSLARLYSIGKSATGTKEIWCLEIGNRETGAPEEKPATYFDGNQHAREAMGGEVTLHLAHYLLSRYDSDAEVKRLVDTRVTYIIQRADPDGAEAFMSGRIDWDAETAPGALDEDGDGRKGEDGPSDIDGDGQIVKMRIEDPDGKWMPYARDARLMIERQADAAGPFYRLMDEGLDDDGDGEVNEDPPVAQFISNRNYPAFWISANGQFRGQGDYPLQEHNARLLVDFILEKPHISQVESFHTTSGIHLRPYAARPDADFPPQDLQDFSAVLAKGTEITTYPVVSVYNDFTTIEPGVPPDEQPGVRHGVFIDWAYVVQGLFGLTTELWTMEPFVNEVGWGDIPRDKPLFAIPGRYNRPDVQAKVLEWLDMHEGDAALSGEGFIEWKPYDHPSLGRVELGGFTRYWLRNPPPGPHFEKVAVDQAKFAVVQALTTPRVKIQNVEVVSEAEAEAETAGRWTITVTAANEGYLDTSLEQARLAGVAKPDRIVLDPPDGVESDDPLKVEFPFMRGHRGSSFLSQYRASFRVRGREGARIEVELHSEKGGVDRTSFELSSGTF